MSVTPPVKCLAQELVEAVLRKAVEGDATASIASVSKWENDDSTLVRLRTKGSVVCLRDRLKISWPLSTVSLVENVVDGYTEAQLLIPSADDQNDIAHSLTCSTTPVKVASIITKTCLVCSLLTFVVSIVINF